MSDIQTNVRNGMRTFLGLRYVPVIKGAWDNTIDYEALSVVTHEGNSYTSKIPVPSGVNINNTDYWVRTSDYNVQIANMQNRLDSAINQILDYATDFESFKTRMLQTYDEFTVTGNERVEEKINELDTFLKSKYNAFQGFVSKALDEYSDAIENLKTSTQTRYNTFTENINTSLTNELNNINTTVSTRQTNFETTLNNEYQKLKNDVKALVLNAGNPENCSAEIITARGLFDTLGERLDNIDEYSITCKKNLAIVTNNGYQSINFNNYTDAGSYFKNINGISANVSIDSFGYFSGGTSIHLFVSNSGSDGGNINNIVQYVNIKGYKKNQFYGYIVAMRTKTSGVWSSWKRIPIEDDTILTRHSYDARRLNTENPLTEYPYEFDFDNPAGGDINRILYHDGFVSLDGISNAPSGMTAYTPFTLITYGTPSITSNNLPYDGYTTERYQMCIFGSGNEFYVRSTINNIWTNWKRLATEDDIVGLREYASNVTMEMLSPELQGVTPIQAIGDIQNITELNNEDYYNNQNIIEFNVVSGGTAISTLNVPNSETDVCRMIRVGNKQIVTVMATGEQFIRDVAYENSEYTYAPFEQYGNHLCIKNLGTFSSILGLNSTSITKEGTRYKFTAVGDLATSLYTTSGATCLIENIAGYQIFTVINSKKQFCRQIINVNDNLQISELVPYVDPRITALETTIGTLNSELETILNGGT